MFPIWNFIWSSAFVCFCRAAVILRMRVKSGASVRRVCVCVFNRLRGAVYVEGPLFRGTVVGVLVAAGSNSTVHAFRLRLVSGVSERAQRMRSVLIGRIWLLLRWLHQTGLAGCVLLRLFAGAEQRGPQAETRRRQVLHVTVVHQSGEEEQEEEQEERQQGDAVVLLNVFSRGVECLGACG